jgi:hypothetical protein
MVWINCFLILIIVWWIFSPCERVSSKGNSTTAFTEQRRGDDCDYDDDSDNRLESEEDYLARERTEDFEAHL